MARCTLLCHLTSANTSQPYFIDFTFNNSPRWTSIAANAIKVLIKQKNVRIVERDPEELFPPEFIPDIGYLEQVALQCYSSSAIRISNVYSAIPALYDIYTAEGNNDNPSAVTRRM